MLGLLAMLGCLLAASLLHAHETGLHDIDHTCISCELEEILSHAAVPSSPLALKTQPVESKTAAYTTYTYTISQPFSSIRAPPLHF